MIVAVLVSSMVSTTITSLFFDSIITKSKVIELGFMEAIFVVLDGEELILFKKKLMIDGFSDFSISDSMAKMKLTKARRLRQKKFISLL